GRTLSLAHFQRSHTVVDDVAAKGSPVFMVEGLDNKYKEQASIVAMNLRAVACLPLMGIPSQMDTPAILGILYLDSTKRMHSLSGLDQKIISKLADEAVNRLNRFLCEKSSSSRFVTMFLFTLSSEGSGKFISAGHNPTYLFRAATGEIEELASNNMIVGAFSFASFQSDALHLNKGD